MLLRQKDTEDKIKIHISEILDPFMKTLGKLPVEILMYQKTFGSFTLLCVTSYRHL